MEGVKKHITYVSEDNSQKSYDHIQDLEYPVKQLYQKVLVDPSQLVADIGAFRIYGFDFIRLFKTGKGGYLNDELINFGLSLKTREMKNKKALSTFFFEALEHNNYDRCLRLCPN